MEKNYSISFGYFSFLQALLELELNSTDLRSSLRELYISGARVSFNNLS